MLDDAAALPNAPRATAVKYVAAMAALLLVTAWIAVADARHRSEDESRSLPTALGDKGFFPGGILPLSGQVLLDSHGSYRGRELFLRSRLATAWPLALVHRVGELEPSGIALYRPASPAKAIPETHFLVLVGEDPGDPAKGLFRELGARKYGSATSAEE